MTVTATFRTSSPAETQALGRLLGALVQPGDIVLLTGGLGAGKTTLTQGIAWGLGYPDHARSPTFVLVNEYQGRLKAYHIDLYRLDNPAEAVDLGLDDYFDAGGVVVIEWAEKGAEALPPEHLHVRLATADGDARLLTATARGARHEALLRALQEAVATRGLGGTRAAGG
jgi:tRNA threonylcarbamoyladenosine biosynthesis protein TsaE